MLCASILNGLAQPGFESKQMKFSRIRDASKIRDTEIIGNLKAHKLDEKKFRMLIMASKQEGKLIIFAGPNDAKSPMEQIRSFDICAGSGKPGPKNMEGDDQVPEGFYHISRFNPESRYHLALEVSYPNEADLKRSKSKKPGGQIMIHGSCVTIGCLPMTNEGIEEIYLYAIKARNNGQIEIPVYIFPAWPDKELFRNLISENTDSPELLNFWENLAIGYQMFREKKIPLRYSITPSGTYLFEQ
jgi:murein L,D-transpeptidase YafK